ncbi:Fungal specific transcription factor domain-containing protein [Cladophialophora immunda]|nr:Fungal specific transcription factor domain-containing protein [Cladophialophora immunda]
MENSSLSRGSKRRAPKACLACRSRKGHREPSSTQTWRWRDAGRRRTTPDTSVEDAISPAFTNFNELSNHPPTAAASDRTLNVPDAPRHSRAPSISQRRREQRRDETANVASTSPVHNRDREFLAASESPLERHQPQTNVDFRRYTPATGSAHIENGLGNRPPLSTNSQFSADFGFGFAGGSEIALPKFIRKTSASLEAEDVQRLRTKGAFIIPDTTLRNELLRCYAQYVHPYLPVLDLQDFLATVEKNEATQTVSLLLFQAVMFAATPYVASRALANHGYNDRRSARTSFYRRVKLLCDMDYELDRLTVIQSTLLMTYWNETPDDPKDVWYWLGVAISLSKRIGLNYEHSPFPTRNLLERQLWKRIWWSCYTRDRLVSLAFRRPVRIRHNEFDQPMLELSDLETRPFSSEVCEMLGAQCPTFRNEAARVSLARLCIGMAELCVCLTPILEMQYHRSNRAVMTTMGGSTDEIIGDASKVLQYDRSLKQWHQTHGDNLHCFNGLTSDHSLANGSQVLEIHKAVLKGLYLTSISILHRGQILSSAPTSILDPEIRDLSRRKTREAANELTVLYTNIYAHGLIRFLPNTGVTCLLHAAITHILDQTNGDLDLQQEARRKFGLCTQALEQLGETYASAAFAFSFLTAAAKKVPSRPETTEASIGLGESMLGVKHKSLSHFGCQFNVPPQGFLQPGGSRSSGISAANSEPSRTPSRRDVRDPAHRSEDTGQAVRRHPMGVNQHYQATAEGIGDDHSSIDPSNRDVVRGRTGDEMQPHLDYFLDMEGAADFFNLSDELGVGFDSEWFDTLGSYNSRDTTLLLG